MSLFNAQAVYGSIPNRVHNFINEKGDAFRDVESSVPVNYGELIPGLSTNPMSSTWKNIIEKPLVYEIKRFYNSSLLDYPSSVFTIDSADNETLIVTVKSPFYNNPPPNVPDGTRTPVVDQYECSEVIFLNSDEEYLRIVLGPRGHHFVAMYEGEDIIVRANILLDIKASISRDRKSWLGTIKIPAEYIPFRTTFFNVYSSRGMGDTRVREAYHPVFPTLARLYDGIFTRVNPIDLDIVLPGLSDRGISDTWLNVIQT